MKMGTHFQELASLLATNNRPDIQVITLETILGLTIEEESIKSIINHSELLQAILSLVTNPNIGIGKNSLSILVNISAHDYGSAAFLKLDCDHSSFIKVLFNNIFDEDCAVADLSCMFLSNLTRQTKVVDLIADLIEKSDISFEKIIQILVHKNYNQKGQKLFYLGAVLSNLSQNALIRSHILNKEANIMQRLLLFNLFESVVKRGGVVGTVRNCCFDSHHHDWLLSDEVDILPSLLLPLAGNAQYDDEDNDKLPLQLQYLPEDKACEKDPDIRCMLLETLIQLCATTASREYMRSKNAYIILRDLHKWEKDQKALLMCENLVNILIQTEEEIGEHNLKSLEVPEHLREKFDEMDKQILQTEK